MSASVTIASGASISSVINLFNLSSAEHKRVAGIQMPAAWTTANLTFSVSFDGGTTYQDYYVDNGDGTSTEYIVAVVAGKSYQLAFPASFPMTNFKIRSGTSGTPVTQADTRALVLQLADF